MGQNFVSLLEVLWRKIQMFSLKSSILGIGILYFFTKSTLFCFSDSFGKRYKGWVIVFLKNRIFHFDITMFLPSLVYQNLRWIATNMRLLTQLVNEIQIAHFPKVYWLLLGSYSFPSVIWLFLLRPFWNAKNIVGNN